MAALQDCIASETKNMSRAGERKRMRFEIKVLLDEPEIGRIVRIGLWELTIDYETEERTWEWRGQPRAASRSDPGRKVAAGVRKTPEKRVARFASLPRLSGRARVQESHAWHALLKP